MQLHELREKADPRPEGKRRIGRGNGSGKGTYCTRGVKGQKARSGFGHRHFFAGGETPLIKRFPKFGFNNDDFRTEYAVVNVGELNVFDDDEEIGPDRLREEGLVRAADDQEVKVLGDGELNTTLTVEAHAFSSSARQKIDEAGGIASAISE